MVLIVTIGPAIDCNDPGARNSKRFPVKANGLVRLRSPGSVGSTGSVSTPISRVPFDLELLAPPLAIWSKTSASWSPRKIEMMAGGGLVGPQPVVVAGRGDRGPQQAAVLVHGADDGGAEDEELGVGVRGVSRQQQVALGRGAEAEVGGLARAVDARERLLVEQALQAVLLGAALNGRHHQPLGGGGNGEALEH